MWHGPDFLGWRVAYLGGLLGIVTVTVDEVTISMKGPAV